MENQLINETLIEDIRSYLKIKTGIYYFKDIKYRADNITLTCPFHKDGQETKPSASLRITNGEKASAGTFHCFTCKVTMGLRDVLKQLLGNLYDEDEVESRFNLSAIEVATSILEEERPMVQFILPPILTRNEEELSRYRYYHQYLASRRITKEVAEVYDIGYDDINKHITFPLRDINRMCLGVGRRSILEKRYEYPKGMIKPLYGVYELPDRIRYLWVVEGPFNLWSLRGWGKAGVALLGTGTKHQQEELVKLRFEGVVLALDPDDAGIAGTKKLIECLLAHRKFNINVALLPNGKDINDLSHDEFRQMLVVNYKDWLAKYN